MRVVPVPCLSDNYSYLVVDRQGEALAVDPAEPDKILWQCKEQRARLEAVLTTHRHKDHAGGNKRLAQHLPTLEIVGGAREGVPGATRAVGHGEELRVGALVVTCLETPYHTQGHMCYLVREVGVEGPAVVFTGDVLFVGGCGRRFQGTPAEMHRSLQMLCALPPDTLVYCGHEYTVANLEFAATVEGSNPAVLSKLEWARQQREAGRPTVPSTIGEELQHNPFLRCHEPAILRHCNTHTSLAAGAGSNGGGSGGEAAGPAPCEPGAMDRRAGGGREDEAEEGTEGREGRDGQLGAADAAVQDGCDEEVVVCTLAELRRLKDNHGTTAKIITAALNVGAWLGWAP